MKFAREMSSGVMIRKVENGEILIGSERYSGSLALTSERVVEEWSGAAFEELAEGDLEALLATEPELILLGTGSDSLFAPRELTFALARKGVGLEAMSTPAAARTFNVLAGEGRRIAAVLYT
ncbi:MAG: MTH938/NDUFAF3 family protein [Woeseiaceae bacterium]|nr:MTH938/NDUFAF3 family protein [Woeseiaceae bacterium]